MARLVVIVGVGMAGLVVTSVGCGGTNGDVLTPPDMSECSLNTALTPVWCDADADCAPYGGVCDVVRRECVCPGGQIHASDLTSDVPDLGSGGAADLKSGAADLGCGLFRDPLPCTSDVTCAPTARVCDIAAGYCVCSPSVPAAFTPRTSGTTETLTAVWGSSASDVFVVGTNSTILHSTDLGNTWSKAPTTTGYALHGIWGSGPNDIYVVGSQGGGSIIYHSTDDGATWVRAPVNGGISTGLFGVWGSSASDVWIASSGDQLLHTVDHCASFQTVKVNQAGSYAAVWGTGPTDLWAVGQATNALQPVAIIVHSTDGGATFQIYPNSAFANSTPGFNAIWGIVSTAFIAVGENGSIYGPGGLQANAVTAALHGIWGTSGDLYIAGDGGLVLHSTGSGSWSAQSTGTTVPLSGVWGSSASDVYVVGANGTILHKP